MTQRSLDVSHVGEERSSGNMCRGWWQELRKLFV